MARGIDDDIDRLYQLPLDEFTAARNALAKGAGPDAARVRALTKPPVAAWAVNQLHWKDRPVHDELIAAAEAARAAHKAVLAGRKGDVRTAGAQHDKAMERALKATLRILADSGHSATDATRQAILQTLRALPSDDPPGRLTKALQPGGFELLTGVKVAGAPAGRSSRAKEAGRAQEPAPTKPTSAAAARAEAARRKKQEQQEKLAARRARELKTAAERALREAEQEARRGEFEVARAERDAQRAQKHLAEVQRELEAARRRVADAQEKVDRLGREGR